MPNNNVLTVAEQVYVHAYNNTETQLINRIVKKNLNKDTEKNKEFQCWLFLVFSFSWWRIQLIFWSLKNLVYRHNIYENG